MLLTSSATRSTSSTARSRRGRRLASEQTFLISIEPAANLTFGAAEPTNTLQFNLLLIVCDILIVSDDNLYRKLRGSWWGLSLTGHRRYRAVCQTGEEGGRGHAAAAEEIDTREDGALGGAAFTSSACSLQAQRWRRASGPTPCFDELPVAAVEVSKPTCTTGFPCHADARRGRKPSSCHGRSVTSCGYRRPA